MPLHSKSVESQKFSRENVGRGQSPYDSSGGHTKIERYKRKPSFLEQLDMQAAELDDESYDKENCTMSDGNVEREKEVSSEKRVKEKSSYKKLIAQMQTSYPHLSQEQAFKGIVALRAKNSGTLSGMTMLDIMEGAISIISPKKTKENESSHDEADEESSSIDENPGKQIDCQSEKSKSPRKSRKRKLPSKFEDFSISDEDHNDEENTGRRKKDNKKSSGVEKSSQESVELKSSIHHEDKCCMCGGGFEDSSCKMKISDKTRETGTSFSSILLPVLMDDKAAVDGVEGEYLCELCVSHLEQMDVYQHKLFETRKKIKNIFKKKSGETKSFSKSSAHLSSIEETISKQSPLQHADVDNAEIASKLSMLSGIEIKRISPKAELDLVVKQDTKNLDNSPSESPDSLNVSDAVVNDVREDPIDRIESSVTEENSNSVKPKAKRRESKSPVRRPSLGRGKKMGQPTPPPPPARSKKSLFESSQRRRSGTPLMTSSPIVASSSSVTSSRPQFSSLQNTQLCSPSIKAELPENLKKQKAYQKLVARIKGVHPELIEDDILSGIMLVKSTNNGTLSGLTMPDIILKVRQECYSKQILEPVGDEFEDIVNSPFVMLENKILPVDENTKAEVFEKSCSFCSKSFKSSSENATEKVYQLHQREHEEETRKLFETSEPEAESKGDIIKSEASYCKPCKKQFKNAKLYGAHQNEEHNAEIEFRKVISE